MQVNTMFILLYVWIRDVINWKSGGELLKMYEMQEAKKSNYGTLNIMTAALS